MTMGIPIMNPPLKLTTPPKIIKRSPMVFLIGLKAKAAKVKKDPNNKDIEIFISPEPPHRMDKKTYYSSTKKGNLIDKKIKNKITLNTKILRIWEWKYGFNE